ncbi:hypothetical protein V6Z11_D05G286600 [Gossypium hirsutum]
MVLSRIPRSELGRQGKHPLRFSPLTQPISEPWCKNILEFLHHQAHHHFLESSIFLALVHQILQPPLQPSLNLPGCSASASSTMASLDGVSGNLGGSHGNWRGGVGLNDGNQDHFRPFDGIYGNTSQRLNSFKSNYSSISDFQHEKGLENVSSRAQGTVDSWISPAD